MSNKKTQTPLTLKEKINAICPKGFVISKGHRVRGKCNNYERFNCAICENFFCDAAQDGYVAKGSNLQKEYIQKLLKGKRFSISINIALCIFIILQALSIPEKYLLPYLQFDLMGFYPQIIQWFIDLLIGIMGGLITNNIIKHREKKRIFPVSELLHS